MNLIKIDSLDKITDIKIINKIAGVISEGKIAILPTCTVYGISCRYNEREAIRKIYRIKKRDINLPFIILISNLDDLKIFTRDISETAKKIINKFWNIENPESLTLILKKSEKLKELPGYKGPTIALRITESRFLREIINICGPIISTSATISGTKEYPKEIGDIPVNIKKKVELIVEYNLPLPGVESTIVDVCGNRPVLIREGIVKFSNIVQKLDG